MRIKTLDVDAVEVIVRVVLALSAADGAGPYTEGRQTDSAAKHLLSQFRTVDESARILSHTIGAQPVGGELQPVIESVATAHGSGSIPEAVIAWRRIIEATRKDGGAGAAAGRKTIGMNTCDTDAVPGVLVASRQSALSRPGGIRAAADAQRGSEIAVATASEYLYHTADGIGTVETGARTAYDLDTLDLIHGQLFIRRGAGAG